MDELDDLLVALTKEQPLSNQPSQILGELRVTVINGLVLAYETAELSADNASTLFHHGIAQQLIRRGGGVEFGRGKDRA